uniref:CSON005304 protein n=1 Tax=Culicoides sonorensis TaxID=179676 RepID=A0A336LXR1_CULSO
MLNYQKSEIHQSGISFSSDISQAIKIIIIALLFACVAVASANYGYAHQPQYVAPVQHAVHSYAAHPPKVDCGHSLLVSCQPQTAKVPCVPNHGHGGHGYAHAAPAHYAAPAHHAAPAHYAAPAKKY